MRVEKTVWQPIIFIGSLNVVLILVLLVMATTIIATPSGVTLNMQDRVRANAQDKARLDIKVTSENVIYVDEKVMTLNELRRVLASPKLRSGEITIRADKRASMGRMMDILNICQGIVKGKVNVISLD